MKDLWWVMILTGEWISKYEQYVCYIPDDFKVNKKYFAENVLQSWDLWMMKEGNSTGK